MDPVDELRAWTASGLAELTGPAHIALGPPVGLVDHLRSVTADVHAVSTRIGRPVRLDGLGVLAERAAIARLERRGQQSCGGASRLIESADGWVAVSLPRPDDISLVPALTGTSAEPEDAWRALSHWVGRRTSHEVEERGRILGLALASLPTSTPGADQPVIESRRGDASPITDLADVVVVDLSSLWAGPLCGSILADAGATVIKVESTSRLDGARRGPGEFFDLLNAGKATVTVDTTSEHGRDRLRDLIASADVVIEASRPRALAQLGVDAHRMLERDRPRVWLSITGHGRGGDAADRIAFGDDAAVAGGLVAWHDDIPYFCADAIADPLTGLVSAATALRLLADGGCWMVDAALARTASTFAAPTIDTGPNDADAPTGRPRRWRGRAAEAGADNDRILGRLTPATQRS